MKTALILAAILAATPAMACTDWRAVAAFDAIIVANAQRDVEDMTFNLRHLRRVTTTVAAAAIACADFE